MAHPFIGDVRSGWSLGANPRPETTLRKLQPPFVQTRSARRVSRMRSLLHSGNPVVPKSAGERESHVGHGAGVVLPRTGVFCVGAVSNTCCFRRLCAPRRKLTSSTVSRIRDAAARMIVSRPLTMRANQRRGP